MRQDEFRREIIIDYICTLSGERVNPLPLFNEHEFRREIIIDYICKLSGERVNPLPLFNEKEYRFQDLRGIAFRWFCINHKIDLLELMELLDKTKYSGTTSGVKLGISKKELKEKNEKEL